MSLPELMRTAAEAANDVVQGVRPDQLSLPTPCADWDVRALINHLLTTSGHMSELVARKQPVDLAALMETDFMTGDWAKDYAVQVDKAAAAWALPGATEGEFAMHGPPYPAEALAGMFLSELVTHGWDLARATGQTLRVSDELAAAVLELNAGMAPEGRTQGLFGEPVTLKEGASTLETAVAIAGRDPR
ncbi:TIGR03086 family metal-binding protein [Tenggerimyces flavus]|uniref:TIGR03086 family metal-binding protein n=1 Tax=Tenggerimyces flavus TaxID=1708749 RepID=A0ABV7Y7Q1_9ACTN|nr:TIGR03086 family metal-binding protein [Tenggerimyces flavus]MBM7785278.1 uncharacterized protein (TIGR03086 family) [Tenggerimyces flavus]